MQALRTIAWIALSLAAAAFVAMNWNRAPVNFWPLDKGYLHVDWPVGIIALVFFLLGLVPMWLLAKAGRWSLRRRIAALENSVRMASGASGTSPHLVASSTQLEADTPTKA